MRRSVLLPCFLLLIGCGGSGGGNGSSNPFGYNVKLYRGNFFASDDLGGSVSAPITVSLSPDEETFQAFGSEDFENSAAEIKLSDSPGSGPSLTSSLSGEATETEVVRTGSRVTISILGTNGITGQIYAELDEPKLSDVRTIAPGSYHGIAVGRVGSSGALTFAGDATGTVDESGNFNFHYNSVGGSSSGFATGHLETTGAVTNPVLADGDTLSEIEQVKAYGDSADFTVAFLYSTNRPEVFFRMRRVGD